MNDSKPRTVRSSRESHDDYAEHSSRELHKAPRTRQTRVVRASVLSSTPSSQFHADEKSDVNNVDIVDAQQLKPENESFIDSTRTSQLKPRRKVVNIKKRAAEARRARWQYWLIRIGITVGTVLGVIFAVWALIFSPLLKLQAQEIRVIGTHTWVQVAQVQKYTTPEVGKSLIVINDTDIAKKIDDIPGVASVKVDKQFPHGLQVTVTEETPTVILHVRDSRTYVAVDSKARQIAVKNATTQGVPVIEVKTIRNALKSQAVKQAIAVLAALKAEYRTIITHVTADTQDSVTTVMSNGYTVMWGDSTSMETKQKEVDQIIQQLNNENEHGGRIDVSAPSRPIVKQ
ncbi:cell division protein FtsQ/DivIB [Alloscardovia venturai]|uniref:Cell division protein FtsQ/DivIB n=1 Tax=Alloscardovia venturai TaxID=1769421 RepID=A0ABW2Y4I5_9BIFI